MPKELLDDAQVSPGIQQMRGKGVSKGVRADPFRMTGLCGRACKLNVRGRCVAPVSRDDAFAYDACQALRIARVTIRGDGGMAVEILADPVADGERIVPEELVQDRDIVIDEGLLVPVELLGELCMHLRIVDFHWLSSRRIRVILGNAKATLPQRGWEDIPRNSWEERHMIL